MIAHHPVRRERLDDGTAEVECVCGYVETGASMAQVKRAISAHLRAHHRMHGGSEDRHQGAAIPPPTPLHRMGKPCEHDRETVAVPQFGKRETDWPTMSGPCRKCGA